MKYDKYINEKHWNIYELITYIYTIIMINEFDSMNIYTQ